MRCVIAMVVMVLASCGPDSAIEIVIGMPEAANVDEVKLYVGLGYTQNMDGSTPERLIPAGFPRVGEQPRGFWWKRDTTLPDGDRAKVAPGTNEVRFVFQPGSHDRMTVIAVGYSDKTVVAAALLEDAYMESGTVRQYVVELQPASPAMPGTPQRPGITVQEWGPKPEDRECAHYRDAEDSVFVVNLGDRDCDGFEEDEEDPSKNLECRPDVYQGFKRAPRNALECVTKEALPGGTVDAVVLGGPGCVDGRGLGSCDVGNVCVDEDLAFCAERSNPLECAASAASAATSITHIKCEFFFEVPQNNVPIFCAGEATLDRNLPPADAQIVCDPTTEYLFWTPSSDKWIPSLVTKNAMMFTAAKPTNTCGWKLGASGGPQETSINGLVTAQLANRRAVGLPFVVHVTETETGCINAPANRCVLEPAIVIDINSAFARCMRSEIVDPW